MSRRANGLHSRNSRTLSESGGSRDLEDDAQEAMQEMLGAQEWHQVRLLRPRRRLAGSSALSHTPSRSSWQGDD